MEYRPLSTDFKDDILDSSNTDRKYRQITNNDGTMSLQDETTYQQVGSVYGAKEINEEREAINNVYTNKLVTLDEIDLVTEEGFFVDALAVKELNSKTKWKLFGTATGIKGINIKELVDSGKDIRAVVTARYSTKGDTIKFVFDISPENVAGVYPDGYCFSNNNYATVAILVGKSYDLFVQKSWWSMRENASTTIPINDETVKLEVYYR